jgi:uncharacterized protein
VAEPAVDPSWIEKIRQSGIRIDREGRFIHQGEEVRHEGLRRALYRWLDRLDDDQEQERKGRYILRLDSKRFAYLDVDDTPLVARAARVGPDQAVWLALSDGADERLDPDTLTVDGDGILRAFVRGGRIEARLANSAAAALADLISEVEGRPALRVAGRLHRIAARRAA